MNEITCLLLMIFTASVLGVTALLLIVALLGDSIVPSIGDDDEG